MLSNLNFISALSTILSSTVFSVMNRKTRTCFFCPIRWARSYRKEQIRWSMTKWPVHPISLTSLCCPHEETSGPWLPIEHTAKTQIRLGRCTDHFVGFVMQQLKSDEVLTEKPTSPRKRAHYSQLPNNMPSAKLRSASATEQSLLRVVWVAKDLKLFYVAATVYMSCV